MKKILLIFIVLLFIAVIFSDISPVFAQSNSSDQTTKKSIVWNSWNKVVSWFTKKSINIKKENIVKAKKVPVVIPVVVPKVSPVSPKTAPAIPKPLLPTPVVVIPPVENKLIVNMEDKQSKILQLDGTEADYSKSESSVENFFLTVDEKKYLPDTSVLLRSYPSMQIHGVNSKGDFVGCLGKNDVDNKFAFAKIKGNIYNIGLIEKGGFYACAYDINEKGQVIGTNSYLDGKRYGFLWEDGRIFKLSFVPLSISNGGIVVGSDLLWKNGVIEDLLVDGEKINKLYRNARIHDINNNDQILISYYPKRKQMFLIWQNGKIIKVDDLVPKLKEKEYIVVDGGYGDSPKFSLDGSLKLRVDKNNLITKIINGDEHNTSFIEKLRYYTISLPNDISAIKVQNDDVLEVKSPNTAYPVMVPITTENL